MNAIEQNKRDVLAQMVREDHVLFSSVTTGNFFVARSSPHLGRVKRISTATANELLTSGLIRFHEFSNMLNVVYYTLTQSGRKAANEAMEVAQ